MPKYETYSKVKQVYDISPQTVRNWARKGQIRYKCIQNETRKTWLFDIESIGEFIQNNTDAINEEQRKKGKQPTRILYARVSSDKQSGDLERQKQLLLEAFPNTEIISDIGSGINFHRPGLTKLVHRICRDEISQVVVTFKDRLARIGFELFELFCKEHNCSILVHSDGNGTNGEEFDPEYELKEDLLSIVNVFVASHNGKRSAVLKKQRKENRNKGSSDGSSESQTVPNQISEKEVKLNDGGQQICLESPGGKDFRDNIRSEVEESCGEV
jgi:predicted site-specific integrase-resolvase